MGQLILVSLNGRPLCTFNSLGTIIESLNHTYGKCERLENTLTEGNDGRVSGMATFRRPDGTEDRIVVKNVEHFDVATHL